MSEYDGVGFTIQSAKFQQFQVAMRLQAGVSSNVRSNAYVRVECRGLELIRHFVRDAETLVVVDLYIRCIVCVVRNDFKDLTRLGHKLFRAPVLVRCKLSSHVVQTEFSDSA